MQVVVGNQEKKRARRCGNCGETGHNERTCQIVIETSSVNLRRSGGITVIFVL